MKYSKIGDVYTLDYDRVVNSVEEPLYLLGVEYDGDIGKALLIMLSNDGSRILKLPDPTDHRPYFLTDEPVDEVLSKKELTEDPRFERVEEVVKINPLTMARQKLTKIVTKDPLAVKKFRALFKNVWEAKIKYHNNYIYDNMLVPGMRVKVSVSNGARTLITLRPAIDKRVIELAQRMFENMDSETYQTAMNFLDYFEEMPPLPKRLALDIEVYTPAKGKVPSPRHADLPVISISFKGSDGLKKVLLLAREVSFGEPTEDYPSDAEVEIFDSEIDMILEAYRIISQYPVVITFNGDNFDLYYLYTRSLKLGIGRHRIPIKIIKSEEGSKEVIAKLETSIHIDLYKFFSNNAIKNYAFGGKYQEENLDAISTALLGISKISFEGNLGEKPLSVLIAYNYRDADITLQLTQFGNEMVWKLMVLMARISRTNIEDICRRRISNWIQNLVFWESRRRNYLIVNKEDIQKISKGTYSKATIEGKKYAGALVIEPPVGVFFNIVVLDIASLYPSIIKKYNLSFETVDVDWCKNKVWIEDETGRKIHSVCIDKPGLMSIIVGILRDFRVNIYKKRAKDKSLQPEMLAWYDIVQRAIKVFINASYGVFGDEAFPLYSPAMAESVTALGRRSFFNILSKASELGVKILYGDTDSIFLWNPTQEQLAKLQEWVSTNLGLEIELDKVFTYIVFTGLKKNYLGRSSDGSIEIKGLIAKKKNTPDFLKNFFEEIVERMRVITSPGELKDFEEWLKTEIKQKYMDLKRREITLDQLVIRTGLTKKIEEYKKNTPPHVKAAIQLRNYGIHVGENDIIAYVKVKSRDGVKPIQLARLSEIDPDKYIENIRSGLEQLLEAIGLDWDGIISNKVTDLLLLSKQE
ncbi:DNA-directed DNA polymerase I [Thermogladius sp. 4427co]|uniref:DNA-directed DNA polymerase I n=1 Tax=Thermogladius sp. 4427co TaxID=3450718 RepID=UPI003F7A0D6E